MPSHLYGHDSRGVKVPSAPPVAVVNAAVIAAEWPGDGVAKRRFGPDEWERVAFCAVELAKLERQGPIWDQHPETFEEVAARIAMMIARDTTNSLEPWAVVQRALDATRGEV